MQDYTYKLNRNSFSTCNKHYFNFNFTDTTVEIILTKHLFIRKTNYIP